MNSLHSEDKWTPGPWSIRRSKSGKPGQISDGRGTIITTWWGIARPASKEGEANARLIAAAPEMAELLWRKDMLSPQWISDRKNLLARINGEDDGDA